MSRQAVKRYETNPFLEDLAIDYVNKQVRINALGKDDNVLVNQVTGEVTGTHVTAFKKVDGTQFIKIFAQNIALTFGLGAPGFKTLMVLAWVMQNRAINRDKVTMDQYTFEEFHDVHGEGEPPLVKNFGIATFRKGLSELVDAKILASCLRKGDYFINPDFIFNGNRIAFTTVLERDDNANPDQYELIAEVDGED
jgi:hypothetical protein